MRERNLVVGGKQVVCQHNQFSELMSVCHVSLSADAVIPGHYQMHVLVSHSQQKRGSGVLEPAVSFMEQQGLIIARSVCSMKREAVSSGYSIHPQLQRKMPSPYREEMIPLVQRSGFQRMISPVDIGRWSLSQLTARKPPLPLHMGCISSVSCHLGFVMPPEHSNDLWSTSWRGYTGRRVWFI